MPSPPSKAPSTTRAAARPAGLYRIATVAELTGIPEPTLRAWERRYGVPSPRRAESGYRLYSDEDVRLVREMRRLSEEGVAVAEGARLLLGRTSPASPGSAAAAADASKDGFALAAEAILDCVDRFDDVGLDAQIRRLLFLGSAVEILDRVLAPALLTVGERWHAGELSVAQEHMATHKLGTIMRDLVRLLPGGESDELVVLGCFADDEHELGLLGLAIRLSEWGLRPLFLGARTPPSAVRSAVQATDPSLVALSVTVTPPRPRGRELVDDYAAACASVPWIVGGSGVPAIADLVEKRGGVVVSPDRPNADATLRPLISRLISGAAKKGTR
jgi:DNA-binding transcriptional MerR regulator